MLNISSDDDCDYTPVIPAVSKPCDVACTQGYLRRVAGTAIEEVSQYEIDRRRADRLARLVVKPPRKRAGKKRRSTLLDPVVEPPEDDMGPPAPPPSPRHCGHTNGRCLDLGVSCPLVDDLGYPVCAMKRLHVCGDDTVKDVDTDERYCVVVCEDGQKRLEVSVA